MPTKRLSEATIEEVQRLLSEGGRTQREIAQLTGVSRGTVSNINASKIRSVEAGVGESKDDQPAREFNPHNAMVRFDAIAWINKQAKKRIALDKLAEYLACTAANAKLVIEHLTHHDGYNLVPQGKDVYQLVSELKSMPKLSLKRLVGDDWSFGLLSDTHIANKRHRSDVLEAAYDRFAELGIKQVFHAGNIIDGEFKGNIFELTAHGVHDQASLAAAEYPQRSGITTYFVTGDCHEGWYQKREGINVGFYIEKVFEANGRTDMVHIGHIEQDIAFEMPYGTHRMRIMHPGGGSAYATSYGAQKMVESFQGGDKPQVLVLGHYHKYCINQPREVITIQPGCVCDQTVFMRKKKLIAEVGFMVCTLGRRIDGTTGRFTHDWYPFYDAKYHQRLEDYTIEEE